MSSVRAAVPLLKKRELRKIVTTTTVSSSIDSREIPGFLPWYYSYSMLLREVRCFLCISLESIELETVVTYLSREVGVTIAPDIYYVRTYYLREYKS